MCHSTSIMYFAKLTWLIWFNFPYLSKQFKITFPPILSFNICFKLLEVIHFKRFNLGSSTDSFNNLAFMRGDDLKGNDSEEATCFTGVLCASGSVSKIIGAEVTCFTGVVLTPSGISAKVTEVEGKLYEEWELTVDKSVSHIAQSCERKGDLKKNSPITIIFMSDL